MSVDVAQAGLLAWYLADFRRFCALLEISAKDGRRIPFKLNEIQKLYCATATQRDVILKPRQIGFTTLILALDVYKFLTVRGARVVIVCQSMTGNGPVTTLAATIKRFFSTIRRAGIALNFSTEKSSEWAIKERDASLRIIVAGASEASAAKAGRSGTVTHLHETEVAFWEYADDTLNALLECVPGIEHGSSIISESTANGAAGTFYRQCRAAQDRTSGYTLHFYPWHAASEYAVVLEPGEVIEPKNERERKLLNAGVTPEQIKWYRRKVAENGQDRTDQEYPTDPETCFLVSGRGFFDQEITAKLLECAAAPIERRDQYRITLWKRPVLGRRYLVVADPSEGGGGDPSGVVIYDWESGEHVASVLGQYTPWALAKVLVDLAREYNSATIAVERNNHGHSVLQALEREHRYGPLYRHDDDKYGWPTNPVTRPTMLDELEDAHRKGHWASQDRALLGQLRTFVYSASGKPEAAPGEQDDLVLAAAIGWAIRSRPRGKLPDKQPGGNTSRWAGLGRGFG